MHPHLQPHQTVVPRAGTWIETDDNVWTCGRSAVVPRAGTWIETSRIPPSYSADSVVPLVETCIETRNEEVRLGVTVESYFLICSKSFFKRVAAVNRSRTM